MYCIHYAGWNNRYVSLLLVLLLLLLLLLLVGTKSFVQL